MMAEGVGHGYFTEFLSQWFLRIGQQRTIVDDPVMLLSAVSNAIVILLLIFLILKKNSQAYGIAIYCSLYAPLFLTTVLRAAPLYVFAFVIFSMYRHRSLKFYILVIAAFGVFFHDTVLLFVLALLFAGLLRKINMNQSYRFPFAACIVLLVLSFVFSSGISGGGFDSLGARVVYLEGDNEGTLAKVVYLTFVTLVSYRFIRDFKTSPEERSILIALLSFTLILNLFSSTLAVRFSTLAVGYVIAVRGVLLFRFEKVGVNPLVLLPGLCALYLIRFSMLM